MASVGMIVGTSLILAGLVLIGTFRKGSSFPVGVWPLLAGFVVMAVFVVAV